MEMDIECRRYVFGGICSDRMELIDEKIQIESLVFRIKTVNWRERDYQHQEVSTCKIALRTSKRGLLIIAWPIISHNATLAAP